MNIPVLFIPWPSYFLSTVMLVPCLLTSEESCCLRASSVSFMSTVFLLFFFYLKVSFSADDGCFLDKLAAETDWRLLPVNISVWSESVEEEDEDELDGDAKQLLKYGIDFFLDWAVFLLLLLLLLRPSSLLSSLITTKESICGGGGEATSGASSFSSSCCFM